MHNSPTNKFQPFQNCDFKFESYGYDTKAVVFKWADQEDPIQIAEDTQLPSYQLMKYEPQDCTKTYSTGEINKAVYTAKSVACDWEGAVMRNRPKKCQKSNASPTDQPTDQRTDGRTDRPNYGDARTHLKILDKSNFDAQGRAESRKIGLMTLRSAVFEQYRLFHRFWGYKWHEKNTLPFLKSFPIFISL